MMIVMDKNNNNIVSKMKSGRKGRGFCGFMMGKEE